MPSEIASIVFGLFIVWLFTRERAMWRESSAALWIPVLWIVVIGSKPLSAWLGYQPAADADVDGSPVDRYFYFALILGAFFVLQRRKFHWGSLIAQNKWLAVYFIYLGISALWSDNPFVSFKRWIKDVGNILMVATILSEQNPVTAAKSVLFRCSSFLIPMSVLYIKYYPNLGRYLDRWTWQYHYGGVTTDKNTLGMTLFVCGLGLSWGLQDLWHRRAENKKDFLAYLLLLLMCIWLWAKINCATSVVCTSLGVCVLLAMKLPVVRNTVSRAGLWGFIIPVFFAFTLNLLFNSVDLVAGGLGRNTTLTGRTPIWREALQVDSDPLLGSGYCNFWQGDRAATISRDLGFYFQLQEAHNGYLDVYLNSGLVGIAILLIVLIGNVKRVVDKLNLGSSYEIFRLAILLGGMVYNITESALTGLGVIWLAVLLSILEYPLARETVPLSTTHLDNVVERPGVGAG